MTHERCYMIFSHNATLLKVNFEHVYTVVNIAGDYIQELEICVLWGTVIF